MPRFEAIIIQLRKRPLLTSAHRLSWTHESSRKQIKEQKKKGGGVRLAIGSGPSVPQYGNFIPTDYPLVDICNATRLSALLDEASVEAMFASHVWEHFTYPQAIEALQNVRCLMTDNAVARFGVPDAQHPDEVYHNKMVREGFPDRNVRAAYRDSFYAGHRALWTEEKFAVAASSTGLNARPLEWWSAGSKEDRKFCYNEYSQFEREWPNKQVTQIRFSKYEGESLCLPLHLLLIYHHRSWRIRL